MGCSDDPPSIEGRLRLIGEMQAWGIWMKRQQRREANPDASDDEVAALLDDWPGAAPPPRDVDAHFVVRAHPGRVTGP